MEDFQFLKVLGKGSFGKVGAGRCAVPGAAGRGRARRGGAGLGAAGRGAVPPCTVGSIIALRYYKEPATWKGTDH